MTWTDQELRAFAEKAIVLHDACSPTGERYRSTCDHAVSAFRHAISPEIVIFLLDRLAKAERSAAAAREDATERVVVAARDAVRRAPDDDLRAALRALDAMRGGS